MNNPKIEPIHMNFPPPMGSLENEDDDSDLHSHSVGDEMHHGAQLGDHSVLTDHLSMGFGNHDMRGGVGLPHAMSPTSSLYGSRDIQLRPYSGVQMQSPLQGGMQSGMQPTGMQGGIQNGMQMPMLHNMGSKVHTPFNQFGGIFGSMPLKPCYLIVDIFHKQRGGKGVWMVIEHGGLIRVTKNVGKRIKLVIKSSIKFKRNEMKLILFDLINPQLSEQDGRFSVENVLYKDNDLQGVNAEYELKIFILAKKLEFQVTINSPLGRFKAESNTFGTHNSGKQRKKRESVEPRPKFVLVPFSGMEGHPHSPMSNHGHVNPHSQPQHMQLHSNMMPSMPVKRKRSEFEDDNSHMRLKYHQEANYSDLRLNFSLPDFISALEHIQKRSGDLFEWSVSYHVSVGLDSDIFAVMANEIYRKYPDAVTSQSNSELRSVRYCDMIPVILFNFTLYLDVPELPSLDLDRFNFSDAEIRDDAYRFYNLLKSSYPTSDVHNDSLDISSGLYHQNTHIKSETEHLMKMQNYKDLLLQTENRTGIAVSVYLHTMIPEMTDFFLVIYKSESLYQQKALSCGSEYKYVFIEPEEDNYNGEYSVVLYIEADSVRLEGFVGLYDLRGDSIKQNIILCNPIPITDSANLFIVGKFYISDEDSNWISSKTVKTPSSPSPYMQGSTSPFSLHNPLLAQDAYSYKSNKTKEEGLYQ
eukprot:TRINITY_DN5102_c0_g1_i1.p1 TRINITY_DN5102_c0_g1~~TRINITY_DN5102_c0_g1_i1.p1  ORF type:complete len:694 (-),score=119.37 TRINITY_DN5102_c0_g1_i1:47-2128(-)